VIVLFLESDFNVFVFNVFVFKLNFRSSTLATRGTWTSRFTFGDLSVFVSLFDF